MENSLIYVYPYLARQILDDYGIFEGICLDIGTGPGYLGIEIAKISNLHVYLIDIDEKVIITAMQNVIDAGISGSVHALCMDVESLSLPDDYADLIVSRGSIWFWKDKVKGIQEIFRVLKKGGIAFIGGGLGRNLPDKYRNVLAAEREKKKSDHEHMWVRSEEYFLQMIEQTQIKDYRLIYDPPNGRWVEIHK